MQKTFNVARHEHFGEESGDFASEDQLLGSLTTVSKPHIFAATQTTEKPVPADLAGAEEGIDIYEASCNRLAKP